jgi:hypothetical protein
MERPDHFVAAVGQRSQHTELHKQNTYDNLFLTSKVANPSENTKQIEYLCTSIRILWKEEQE